MRAVEWKNYSLSFSFSQKRTVSLSLSFSPSLFECDGQKPFGFPEAVSEGRERERESDFMPGHNISPRVVSNSFAYSILVLFFSSHSAFIHSCNITFFIDIVKVCSSFVYLYLDLLLPIFMYLYFFPGKSSSLDSLVFHTNKSEL